MLKKGVLWSSAGSVEPSLTKAAIPPEFQQSRPTLPCAAAHLAAPKTSLESQHAQNQLPAEVVRFWLVLPQLG